MRCSADSSWWARGSSLPVFLNRRRPGPQEQTEDTSSSTVARIHRFSEVTLRSRFWVMGHKAERFGMKAAPGATARRLSPSRTAGEVQVGAQAGSEARRASQLWL